MPFKSLTTLIRLQKQRTDALRRVIARLESNRQQLFKRDAALAAEMERELTIAATQTDMSGFFGNFAARIRAKREAVKAETQKLDKQLAEARDQLSEAFAEQKRYEIALENREAEAKATLERKDAQLMDEIATTQHQRKTNAPAS